MLSLGLVPQSNLLRGTETMDMKQAINQVIARRDLSGEEMTDVMHTIMTGGATPAQIGGFLVGLRMKGETVSEIARLQGTLRYTHLKYHLMVKSIVTSDQVALYDRLRGYAGSGDQGGAGHHGHHPR